MTKTTSPTGRCQGPNWNLSEKKGRMLTIWENPRQSDIIHFTKAFLKDGLILLSITSKQGVVVCVNVSVCACVCAHTWGRMNKYFVTVWQGHEFSELQVFHSVTLQWAQRYKDAGWGGGWRTQRGGTQQHVALQHSGGGAERTKPRQSCTQSVISDGRALLAKRRRKKRKKRTLTFSFMFDSLSVPVE